MSNEIKIREQLCTYNIWDLIEFSCDRYSDLSNNKESQAIEY